ncbi:MAG: hypothetical protein L7A77_01590 [Xylella fastidiosa subsp. multiplex]|nr:hypothetical protein [Xylella fastidiosa subsp. multiplex]
MPNDASSHTAATLQLPHADTLRAYKGPTALPHRHAHPLKATKSTHHGKVQLLSRHFNDYSTRLLTT